MIIARQHLVDDHTHICLCHLEVEPQYVKSKKKITGTSIYSTPNLTCPNPQPRTPHLHQTQSNLN